MHNEQAFPSQPGDSSADCLAHLSSGQIEVIYQRYLAGESATALKDEYGIVTTDRGLVRLLPPINRGDRQCPYCQKPMLQDRRTLKGQQPTRLWCPVCEHQEDEQVECHCNCEVCGANRHRAVMDKLCARPDGVPLSDLTLRQAVLLMAYFWPRNEYDNMPVVPAYADAPWPFALTRHQHHQFMAELTGASLIRLATWTPAEGAEEYLKCGRIDRLQLMPNVLNEEGEWCSRVSLLYEIPDRHAQNKYPNWYDELARLGTDLLVDQAIAYLVHHTTRAGIMLTVSPTQRELVRRLVVEWENQTIETVMGLALEVVADRPNTESQARTVERLWHHIEGMFASIPQGCLDETPNGEHTFAVERVSMAVCQSLRLPMPTALDAQVGRYI